MDRAAVAVRQAHGDAIRIRDDLVELADVLDRDRDRHFLLVGRGECIAVAVGEHATFELVVLGDQRIAQPIVPGAHRFGDHPLHCVGVRHRRAALREANDHVDARQRRVRQLHLRFDRAGLQLLADQRLDLLAHLGVVAIARYEDQPGIEATERVATQEDAHALALVQVHDAAYRADEVGHVGLEQLVARIRLQHACDGPAVMAGRIQPEMSDDPIELVAQQRNLARAEVVDRGGEQPEEAFLAGDAAGGVDMKLVREAGGEAIADTSWSILSSSGDPVREVVGAFASLVLAEGDYTIIAKNKDRIYQRDFTVVGGRNQDVEVLATEANTIQDMEGAD